jgi:hypothetical protein
VKAKGVTDAQETEKVMHSIPFSAGVTANRVLNKNVKGQQIKGDSVGNGQHKSQDLELNGQLERGELAPILEKFAEGFNEKINAAEKGKGIDVAGMGIFKMGSGGKQGGIIKKLHRWQTKKRQHVHHLEKLLKAFLKMKRWVLRGPLLLRWLLCLPSKLESNKKMEVAERGLVECSMWTDQTAKGVQQSN